MKRFLPYLIAIALITGFLFLPGKADACRWRLYDNFNIGYINPDKWIVRENTAVIYIEDGRVFRKDKPVVWRCLNCGYLHEGTEALSVCPACDHPQAHFELLGENW